ncbi:MAG: Mu-like prophage major head subunit gpT family protein, partial [Gammaproteobacteria bacterium]
VYALGSSVTLEMFEDEQYNFIQKIPSLLADSINETYEVVAFNVLNRAFNASFLGADGVVLASTAHPLVGQQGATYSNRPTVAADLTQTSLENAFIAISDFVDDQSKKINLKAKLLIVPTALQFTAEKILGTAMKVDSADNTMNPMKGKVGSLVVPFLTDSDAWFLQTNCQEGLIMTMKRAAKLERTNEFDTQNLKFATTCRLGVNFVNPRCIYASPGA